MERLGLCWLCKDTNEEAKKREEGKYTLRNHMRLIERLRRERNSILLQELKLLSPVMSEQMVDIGEAELGKFFTAFTVNKSILAALFQLRPQWGVLERSAT